jgi:hypothetical protein
MSSGRIRFVTRPAAAGGWTGDEEARASVTGD